MKSRIHYVLSYRPVVQIDWRVFVYPLCGNQSPYKGNHFSRHRLNQKRQYKKSKTLKDNKFRESITPWWKWSHLIDQYMVFLVVQFIKESIIMAIIMYDIVPNISEYHSCYKNRESDVKLAVKFIDLSLICNHHSFLEKWKDDRE